MSGRARTSHGFSIVELMVAVTLALVVTAAVLSVFVASRASYSRTTGTASLSDGGRFALDFLQSSVREAGYIVCNTANRNMSILNTAKFATPLAYSFTQALSGFEAKNTAGAGAYALTATSASNPVALDTNLADWNGGLDAWLQGQVVKNNDVLVIYTTAPNTQPAYVTAIVDGATTFTVNSLTVGSSTLATGELIGISDCSKSVVMWTTGVAGLTVTHDGSGGFNTGGGVLPASFSIGSQVAPVDAVIYYIGQGADGDGALFSMDLNSGITNNPAFPKPGTELVPDIEAMQILYGVDTTGTQTVSDYVTADQVPVIGPNGWASVISVKIALLAASQLNAVQASAAQPTYTLLGTTVTAPANDTRARQVFEMTIGLRNQAQ
jgi:type IV pilus assembly protein PilW